MPSYLDLTVHFWLQMAVILAVYRLLWLLFKRLAQVQVVAIMAAGFLLGPSVLGAVWPQGQRWLFPTTLMIGGHSIPHPSLTVIYIVGQLGLVLYMFLVGASFRTGILTKHLRAAGATSVSGVAVPLILGGVTGAVLATHGHYFTSRMGPWQAGLFLAAAVSITAFPVLAWIIHDSGLDNTRLGTMALSLAAFDDALSGILLVAVVASTKGSMTGLVVAVVGGAGFMAFMLLIGRPLFRLLDSWAERERRADGTDKMPVGPLTVILMIVLLCSWFTDLVGVLSVVGAFVAGMVMPRGRMLDTVCERIEPIVSYLLLPAYFIYSGLNTKLSVIMHPAVLIGGAVVLIVSFAGKFGAVTLAARWQGMTWRESGSMGALANARGLMELVLINVGLTANLITPELYTILVLMTMVTTLVATPIFRIFERNAWKNGLVFSATGETIAPANEPAME